MMGWVLLYHMVWKMVLMMMNVEDDVVEKVVIINCWYVQVLVYIYLEVYYELINQLLISYVFVSAIVLCV